MAKKKAKGKKPVRPLVGTGINFLIKTRDLLKGKKGFQKDGGIIKASSGKMTKKDKFETQRAGNKAKRDFEKVMVPDGKGGFEARMVPSTPKTRGPVEMTTLEEKIIKKIRERTPKQGMSKGGMCRGMGAALRGGDFKGVK
jgi:hypothetical protein